LHLPEATYILLINVPKQHNYLYEMYGSEHFLAVAIIAAIFYSARRIKTEIKITTDPSARPLIDLL
jgi:hypothetical protein